MPRAVGTQVENKFIRGLITEATGLNFPEDACTETFNCVFDDSGRVSRRLGIDYELNYTTQAIADLGTNVVVVEYEWESVSGDGTLNFIVIQVGDTLHFYQTDPNGATSPGYKSFTFDLTTYKTSGSPAVETEICQFASGNGSLFVVHPYSSPFFIDYDSDTDTISSTKINVQIRDFVGVDDGLEIDDRPSTLSKEHKYNLFNQGWHISAATSGAGTQNVLNFWDSRRSDFPSNADIWYIYKDSTEDLNDDEFDRHFFGNTQAPQGHYLLDAFNQDRSTVSGVAGLPVESAGYQRPSTVAFFAGRVWYAGVSAKGFNSHLYFSQIIEAVENDRTAGKCYQNNDPTSEDQVDLLDSDGGVIVIPEVGNIISLFSMRNSLLIFCSNGIWLLSGGEGTAFKATDYSISKLSSFSVSSPLSIIDLGGLPMWWNYDNIFTATVSNELNTIEIRTVTEETIKTFIRDIPTDSKKFAKGRYNSNENLVVWLYRLTAPTTIAEQYEYNAALVLNTLTGAFFPWTFGSSTPKINGLVVVEGQGGTIGADTVIDSNLDTVVNSTIDTIVSNQGTSASLSGVTKYLTNVSGSLTFSEITSTTYKDWFTFDAAGIDYSSYGIGGYKVHGEGIRPFQTNYIYTFMDMEANSSLYIQAYWGYGTSETSNRLSTEQQAYKTRTGHSYSRSKLKVRGKGEAMQLKFRSETGKPFSLVGWSLYESANAAP